METREAISQNPFEKLQIHIQAPRQLPRTIPEHIIRDLLEAAYMEYQPGAGTVLRDILVLELAVGTMNPVPSLCASLPKPSSLGP